MKKIAVLTIFMLYIFFSANAQVQATQSGLLNGASVFTVEFWVKTIENRSNPVFWQRPYLFGNETNGENSGDFGIVTNNGYIGMWEGISNLNRDQQLLSNSVRINDNLWHHIAAVNNGQMVNLFVDGNIVGSLVTGQRLNTFNAPLTFGAASLDHAFAGNMNGNMNFPSQAEFGEVRISNIARYNSNFIPERRFYNDGNTISLLHFGAQDFGSNTTTTLATDPNKPVSFDPSQPINDAAAQTATLFLNDSTVLYGRLLLGKKDWSFSNDIYIRFFEGSSKKVKYFKPEEVSGFKMGDSYYVPKLINPGAANTPLKKTMVKQLTPPHSKMGLYEYDMVTSTKNARGYVEYQNVIVYLVELPHTNDDRVYQFSDNKFTPKFDSKVSAIVADNPQLADKIRSKDKSYFYAFVTQDTHQFDVWMNIINEYNR